MTSRQRTICWHGLTLASVATAALLLVGWRYVLADPASAVNVATAQPLPGHAKLLGTIEPALMQFRLLDEVRPHTVAQVELTPPAAPALLPQGVEARPIARSLMSYAPKSASRTTGSIGLAPEFDSKLDQFIRLASMIEPMPDPAPDVPLQYLNDPNSPPPVSLPPTDSADMTELEYLREVRPDLVRPNYLRSPSRLTQPGIPLEEPLETFELLDLPMDAPLGFTGPSSVYPREAQTSSHFVPVEDRWRIGLPEWDRYGLNHPPLDDYPYNLGRKCDPYHQNVLKGDYPIIGQHTFLNVTAEVISLFEGRQVPTPNTPFESTPRPDETDFFGNPNQFFNSENFILSFDLFHGDAAFKPMDWRIKLTPVFNFNYLDVEELGVVNPNVLAGTTRFRDQFALQEWFAEMKLADTSPAYDFTSIRVGSQPFISDFRGFVFQDVNRALRIFGTQDANRNQFNFYYQYWQEKETNSELNTFVDRPKQTFITNFYRQDFIWPGYTTQFNFIYDRDRASFLFDSNDFLVRPDAAGVATPHSVNSYYIGWTGEGHINRFNISHSWYWVLGRDTLNPIAGQATDIDAQFVAIELSYDRDWARFRQSFLYSSGDDDPLDDQANGFDSIIDNPNFAGGGFSFWDRQAIKLFGVNLKQRLSLVPDLRSNKIQGQPNFVNPGLYLYNTGIDFDVTPKLRLISNLNLLWFDQTQVLEQFVFQANIARFIGTDLSLGMEYRPHLNNNIIVIAGVQGLVPGEGFRDLYNPIVGNVPALFAGFMELALKF